MSKEIAINSRGMLRPTTMGEAMDFAKLVSTSSLVPAPYRGKAADVLIAIQMGAELGLAPMQALQSIAVISGKPAVYGDALMALVRSSPLCESVVETYEGDGDALTAVCLARRRGQPEPVMARFSVADAKKAKLWGKSGPWTDYPKIMLKHRARGFCLRDCFADLLRGIITREEAEDYPVDARPRVQIDVTPKADLDAFAAGEIVDQATGEVSDRFATAGFLFEADAIASKGTRAFRDWWTTLTVAQRDLLRPELAQYQASAAKADAAIDAAEAAAVNEDPFGLPPVAPAEDAAAPGWGT